MKLKLDNSSINFYILKIGLIISMCGLIAYFIILPSIKKTKDNYSVFITQKIENEKKIEKEKKYSNLSKKLEKIRPMMEKIDNLFIDPSSELELITSLETIADKNNVKQTINIEIPDKKKKNQAGRQNLNLALIGNYNNLYGYLASLEKSNYYINIYELNISGLSTNAAFTNESSDSPQSETSPLTMNIKADIYWN